MPPLDFPNTPAAGELFSVGGVTWRWDGVKWTTGLVVGTPVPPGGSIQAAIDALPATGGTVLLSPNTVYDITTTITIPKSGVRLIGPSWATILRRNAAMVTENVIHADGANCVIEGFTVDANFVTVDEPTLWEVVVTGAGSLVRGMQIINSGGNVMLGLLGQNSRATGNTLRGLGISLSTERGQGIWALNGDTVTIDNNVITGVNTSAIGADGNGTRVIGNYMANCHCYTGGPGGAIYNGAASHSPIGKGLIIADNYIGPGGSLLAQGIEVWMPNTNLTGNVIEGVQGQSILLFCNGVTVTGNSIRNCGAGPNVDAILVAAGMSDFVISGNHIYDDRATPVMRAGVWVNAGASDRYAITGNLITGATSQAVYNYGTGANVTVANNQGNNDKALPLTGGTINGRLKIAAPYDGIGAFELDGAVDGHARSIEHMTGGVRRFQAGMLLGTNGDSNWLVAAYDNAGAYASTPMNISRATGVVTFQNPIVNGSDRRLKTAIEPVTGALDIVGQLQGVFYEPVSGGRRQVGLIAQDVIGPLPEVVFDGIPNGEKGLDLMMGVSYPNIVAVLIEAIKELNAKLTVKPPAARR